MVVPGRVAVDASAARDAGRLDAILEMRQEEVRDCQSAADRDFLSAVADPELLVLPARQRVQERHRAQPPRDAWQKVVYRTVPQVA